MAIGGNRMLYLSGVGMTRLDDSEPNKNYHLMQSIIERSRVLEKTNRLWPANDSKAK